MADLGEFFAPLIVEGNEQRAKRGRKPMGEKPLTRKQQSAKWYGKKREARLKHIAVLDTETDPFTDDHSADILPFAAEIYSDQFGSIVIWEEDFESFIEKLYNAIESLPDTYTIYCHNGGKFDYMFLITKLRGRIKFKGRAIMSCRIGKHELRDSLHVLPEKLAAWKKDKFDYSKMLKSKRRNHKQEILDYLHSDCVYLFDFIKRFTQEFGLKISIGAAAFGELKKSYKVETISEKRDAALRPYYFGGRVDCIAGRGVFESWKWQQPYRLFDVNSMYPAVMANCVHPVSANYVWHRGEPRPNTFFIDVTCRSYGAFVKRKKALVVDPFSGEALTLDDEEIDLDDHEGRFFTTIHEFNAALKLGLIENVQIHWCVDNADKDDFSRFIVPMYARRQEVKAQLKELVRLGKRDSTEYEELRKEDFFLKYLMNNAYGKFSQNPRRYKEYFLTDHGQLPDKGWFDFLHSWSCDCDVCHRYRYPAERTHTHDVWVRPNPGTRYNNVGVAASITGAARAVLMEARANALDPIYCDTDSLICRDLTGVEIHPTKLGAWDLEQTFDNVIIVGKKTYCCEVAGESDCSEHRLKVRSKGVDLRIRPNLNGIEIVDPTPDQWNAANRETWKRYLTALDDQIIEAVQRAPTISKAGLQQYISRRIRATAPLKARTPLTGVSQHGSPIVQNGARQFSPAGKP